MRSVALGVVFLSLAGCKSGRDYTSVNRTSREFVSETFREGNQLRKKNLKETTAFSERAPGNKRVRKESLAFAWQSVWQEEWEGFSEIRRGIAEEREHRKAARLSEIRFGFLDSGS
jgi:hypothetical protein